jgi:hypothetical protein
MSLATADAARARRQAATTPGYYSVQAGPTSWHLEAALGTELNSNVNLTESNPAGDVIFRPEIRAHMNWPLTDKNSLNLRLGLGYSAYTLNPGLSRLFVTPGSELSFNILSEDFTINLHDRFWITQAAYQDPTVVGTGDYARLQNALGLAASRDLNKILLRAGYDHVNYVDISGQGTSPEGQAEVFYGSAGYRASSIIVGGLELGSSLLDYSTATQPDAFQWHAGLFGEGLLSEYLRFRASTGYSVYSPDSSASPSQAEEFSGIYLQLQASHRLNEYFSHTLSGGRTVNPAFYGGTIETYFLNWAANWHLFRQVTLTTFVNYQYGVVLQTHGEKFDWLGGGVTLGRPIARKVWANLGYQAYWRQSDQPGRSYLVNMINLQFTYIF